MRRAFTLIELLTIVAVIAAMVSMSVINIRSGQSAVRLRSATRDIFAAVRHARSLALVSKEPCVVTYSTERDGESVRAKITVDGAKIIHSDAVTSAETLQGETVMLIPQDEPAADNAAEAPKDEGGGKSVEEILFSEIASEVVEGVRMKVVMEEDDAAAYSGDRRAKPRISVFSNVDYLIGLHNEKKAQETKEPVEEDDEPHAKNAAAPDDGDDAPVKVVWEVNGRTEPHRIWLYLDGSESNSGLSIKVDRFGGMKVLGSDGAEVDE